MNDLPEDNKDQTPALQRGRRPSKDTLNLVIAVCAVLISAASFVASYMQSEAAFRQVQAETWPYLQIESGNTSGTGVEDDRFITYSLANVGVGPADVKSFELYYDGNHIKTINDLMPLCCMTVDEDYDDQLRAAGFVTSTPAPKILASGGNAYVFGLPLRDHNSELWSKLDRARFKLKAKACYCSLLGECYETDFVSSPVEVTMCRTNPELNYRG